jgi:RNA-directed DNA polymerase
MATIGTTTRIAMLLEWSCPGLIMKNYKNLYSKIYDKKNLILAWKKARKGKTKRKDVIEFEKDLRKNILKLHHELQEESYSPKPLENFILRDPKTRKISKSDFRDRIVHHALCNIIEPIFEKVFIYDSCANRTGKGNLFAIKRFEKFQRRVSNNGKQNGWFSINQIQGYCLKCDIKHYFQEINHEILLEIVKIKIKDEKAINLIIKILKNSNYQKGMPLGNLTSQFFANVYLNELDYFVKHKLKIKYYIRYVDDFVILHKNKDQLEKWKLDIDKFLRENLQIELHSQKSRIILLSRGVDFVGFRNFYYFRLLRKRSIRKMKNQIRTFNDGLIEKNKFQETYQGWSAYASWTNNYNLRNKLLNTIISS